MKRLSSWIIAACMAVCAAGVTVLAYAISTTIDLTGTVYDDNGKDVTVKYEVLFDGGNVTIDRAPVGEKLYFEIGNGTDFRVAEGMTVDAATLANSDHFSYTLERGENGDLLDYARLVTKRFDDGERRRYFEIALVVPQEDQKQAVAFDLSFKAKHTEDHYWQAGDAATVHFEFWIGDVVHQPSSEDSQTPASSSSPASAPAASQATSAPPSPQSTPGEAPAPTGSYDFTVAAVSMMAVSAVAILLVNKRR
ncbi:MULTISPECIES: hypothetical protein [Anaerotruncus]|jgi:hypothetical protein|uniref:hypothetical protein n=1 Tax=Anaerotruncus TaxID=244127 RepID=UPI0021700BFA|nr:MULTISPECIES: hypothetical protein [Anaerotruncus]MCI8494055.1 hypothetical protein [Anaerotruncus sp.]